MKIVQVSAEVAPYSKSGGLGDAVAALSKALAAAGHEVWTISPRYRGVAPDAEDTGLLARIPLGAWEHGARIFREDRDGVRHLFVGNGMYDRDGLYGDANGSFGDNHIRFALLAQAALHAARRFVGDDVVFHCHDWQGALLPAYLKAYWRPLGHFPRSGSVLTMHNPAHQGRLPPSLFVDLELPARWFTPWGLEFYGDLCLLKGGILHADQLTTVSPTFAREIVTPGGGFGLEEVIGLRAADLTGILNGVDPDEWSPTTDRHLPATYDAEDLTGKASCKAALQGELGLPVAPDTPLLVSVGRLDPQKGVELLADSVPWLAGEGCQVVVLGSAAAAHKTFEHRLIEAERAHKAQVRAWIGYDEALAHRLMAAADLFVMPSLFEPCGLTQMYAQAYGTPPVVRRTGGLADTVEECDPWTGTGTGFFFERPSGTALRDALWRGISLYRSDRDAFDLARKRGMRRDFSWGARVERFVEVYERAQAVRSG
ncbi:MAG: glycogen synthase [Alphaproteobacteria bacterium]|nr:glycogen synthase [Alphaproteobacteria bacterium]MCB9697868.1 glycogen synthase [Alphaproteobacteria bacterium]